ncbi:hypothetical protein E4V51_18680 [Paenibacillus sp. 28ISP30-2]|nr:hypothetical protein [Paenibacillus sp. 28ISP30-2]
MQNKLAHIQHILRTTMEGIRHFKKNPVEIGSRHSPSLPYLGQHTLTRNIVVQLHLKIDVLDSQLQKTGNPIASHHPGLHGI